MSKYITKIMSSPKEIARLEENFARVMRAQQFILPSFTLYGGVAGFQTYGVLGRTFFQNITEVWRKMFILDMSNPLTMESMVYEIDTPVVTPHPILKASGHVDRFTDPIVYDKDGKLERVDHYLKKRVRAMNDLSEVTKNELENQIDSNDKNILQSLLIQFGEASREFGPIQEVNLMLSTHTSYANTLSYLRPETAQGAFTEFKNIFNYNKERLPFGIVNIGKAFRKEVSPVPFTRLREFHQAELEYFYDPTTIESISSFIDKLKSETELTDSSSEDNHDDSKDIFDDMKIKITTRDHPDQIQDLSIMSLIRMNLLENVLIFKFIFRALMFCFRIGIDPNRLRLRQHRPDELAHYSSDCWDIEFDMSFDENENHAYQWLEIIVSNMLNGTIRLLNLDSFE